MSSGSAAPTSNVPDVEVEELLDFSVPLPAPTRGQLKREISRNYELTLSSMYHTALEEEDIHLRKKENRRQSIVGKKMLSKVVIAEESVSDRESDYSLSSQHSLSSNTSVQRPRKRRKISMDLRESFLLEPQHRLQHRHRSYFPYFPPSSTSHKYDNNVDHLRKKKHRNRIPQAHRTPLTNKKSFFKKKEDDENSDLDIIDPNWLQRNKEYKLLLSTFPDELLSVASQLIASSQKPSDSSSLFPNATTVIPLYLQPAIILSVVQKLNSLLSTLAEQGERTRMLAAPSEKKAVKNSVDRWGYKWKERVTSWEGVVKAVETLSGEGGIVDDDVMIRTRNRLIKIFGDSIKLPPAFSTTSNDRLPPSLGSEYFTPTLTFDKARVRRKLKLDRARRERLKSGEAPPVEEQEIVPHDNDIGDEEEEENRNIQHKSDVDSDDSSSDGEDDRDDDGGSEHTTASDEDDEDDEEEGHVEDEDAQSINEI